MADATSPPKTHAEIPQSAIEYTLAFEAPVIQLGDTRAVTIMEALEALKPWGFSLDGLETKLRSDKASEHAIIFRRTRPARHATSLNLFYDKIQVLAENLDWEGAEDLISMVTAGIDSVRRTANPIIKAQHIVAGVHIQLKDRQVVDVVRPLLSPQALRLADGELKFPGVIVTGQQSNVIIEASVLYANALWVRLFRDHSGSAALPEIAAALRSDETRLFEVLGLEGIL